MFFLALVPLWPATGHRFISEEIERRRLALADLVRNVWITIRRFAKPLPHRLPGALMIGQFVTSGQNTVLLRIERQLGLTHRNKGLPFVLAPGSLKRLTLIQPQQQVPGGITAGQ